MSLKEKIIQRSQEVREALRIKQEQEYKLAQEKAQEEKQEFEKRLNEQRPKDIATIEHDILKAIEKNCTQTTFCAGRDRLEIRGYLDTLAEHFRAEGLKAEVKTHFHERYVGDGYIDEAYTEIYLLVSWDNLV